MRKHDLVELNLSEIGWGIYQNKLLLNCLGGWVIANMWITAPQLVAGLLPGLSSFEQTLIAASINIGGLIGCFLFSSLSDMYGRSYIFKLLIFVELVGALLFGLSLSYSMLILGSLVLGLGAGGDSSTAPGVIIESMSARDKGKLSILSLGYCLGSGVAQLVALFLSFTWSSTMIPQWRALCGVLIGMTAVAAYYRTKILETPQYLLQKSKHTELFHVLKRIADENSNRNYEIIHTFEDDFLGEEEEITEQSQGILLVTLVLACAELLVTFGFNSFTFYLTIYLEFEAQYQRYLLLSVMQVCGICGVYLSSKLVDSVMGRKWTFIVFYFLNGALMVAFIVIEQFWLLVIMSGLCNWFQYAGTTAKNLLIAESFPKSRRNTGIALMLGITRLGSIIAPICAGLLHFAVGSTWSLVIYSAQVAFAGVLALLLKETRVVEIKTD